MKARGIGRMADNDKAILLIFDRRLTDDEMRYLHDTIAVKDPDPTSLAKRIADDMKAGTARFVGPADDDVA